MADQKDFTGPLIAWQKRHGRHDLPWQKTRDPYRVWLSEIMLQQTQVGSVIAYYDCFLARFPTLAALAAAPLDDVLALWSGLGYYSRARNLHKAAQQVAAQHGGRFPADFDALLALPGIGRSTAAAISAFAFGARRAILDGNVKRVLARFAGIDAPVQERAVENRLWALAESLLPDADIEAYTQGLMDLGAGVCRPKRPDCPACPLRAGCTAHRLGRTADWPVPRRRAPLPQRDTQVVLARCGARVYLERRPESGIWGGLYSLPEVADDAVDWCRETLGALPATRADLPPVQHVFTHFRLRLLPVRLELADLPPVLPADGRWMTLTEALAAGLPAPVRRLLAARRTSG